MAEVAIIGVDLAKHVFQEHGARADGSVAFRKKLSRDRFLSFIAVQPRCVVAMEACGTAHGWGHEIEKLGHEVRLLPPIYVKPYVKRHKNDAADAEAIAEAASRPTMRFVAVQTEAQQARAMAFRTRDLLVRQRPSRAPHSITRPDEPNHHAGIDVSLESSSVCLVETSGKVIAEALMTRTREISSSAFLNPSVPSLTASSGAAASFAFARALMLHRVP